MPIGPITMLLTSVGLQIYNNWCGSRQNDQLRQKREEYERAARERNTEHMRKLLREGQELTLRLEEENHRQRLDDLKNEIDQRLQELTFGLAIGNWPLKVLPIVMKNQAFGNLLANQEERVALHVIFARSNYDKFNRVVYPIVEKELEQYCGRHWSVAGDHPILFYSGAWKTQDAPSGVQVSAMRTALSNLPTLLIVPFFRPNDGKLVFQVHTWGVGATSTDEFCAPEIDPVEFQRSFNNQDNYEAEKGLLEEIVEDVVPYLQCLIGYIADTYFWSSAGWAPHLPLLVTNGSINTDGMPYLVSDSREYYDKLLQTSEEKAKENPFMQEYLLNLYDGCFKVLDEKKRKTHIETHFLSSCHNKTLVYYDRIEDALMNMSFSYNDVRILNHLILANNDPFVLRLIEDVKRQAQNKIHCSIIEKNILPIEDVFIWCEKSVSNNQVIQYVSIEISEDKIIATLFNHKKEYIDDEYNPKCGVFTYKHLVIPDYMVINKNTLLWSINQFLLFYNQIIN